MLVYTLPCCPSPLLPLEGSSQVEIGTGVFPYLFSTLNLHSRKDLGYRSLLNLYQELQVLNNKEQDLLRRNVLEVTSPVGTKCTGGCLLSRVLTHWMGNFHHITNTGGTARQSKDSHASAQILVNGQGH